MCPHLLTSYSTPTRLYKYDFKFNETEYATFNTFPTTTGRDAHLNGKVAAALIANPPTLLMSGPEIDKVDILAAMVRPVSMPPRPACSEARPTRDS